MFKEDSESIFLDKRGKEVKESCLKKINNICYGIVSIISAIGLTCSFTIAPEKISGAGLEEYSQIVRFFIYCINILSGDRLITLALIIFYFCILRKINSLKSTKIEKILAGIFALLFAFMQVLGKSYASNNSWDAVFMSKFVFLRACAYGMAVGILIYGVVLYLFKKIDAILHENNDKGNSISIVKLAMMFFICWLPYFAVFYPGTGNGDTASQIMQYHHIYTAILKLSSLQGESIFASNHHPYFLTLVFGIFSKIGLWLGNIDYGIAIYVILQMLLFAFTLAYMWKYLQELGTTFKYIRFGIIFMAIVPIVPLHSICMVKDTLFSICCLVLTLHLTEIIRYDGEKLKEFKFCLLLFITCVLFALTKNQGVYFLIVLFTVFFVYIQKILEKYNFDNAYTDTIFYHYMEQNIITIYECSTRRFTRGNWVYVPADCALYSGISGRCYGRRKRCNSKCD